MWEVKILPLISTIAPNASNFEAPSPSLMVSKRSKSSARSPETPSWVSDEIEYMKILRSPYQQPIPKYRSHPNRRKPNKKLITCKALSQADL